MMKFIFVVLMVPICCLADVFEIFDKLSAQVYGFYSYATNTEENFHDTMHQEVRYFFYPKIGKEVQIYKHDSNMLKEHIKFDQRTIIVVHGYTDNKNRNIIVRLRKALLKFHTANIIVCDWRKPAKQIYFTAVTNTYFAGKELGEFLHFLEGNGYDLGKVHLIGHSLGAHISGVAGSKVDGRIGRITGLDPAGPLFEFFDKRNTSLSLDRDDAQFVDVVHSAMGSFGVIKSIGHADFYPNDGMAPQPGCYNLLLAVSCSHVRSVEYFIESLNPVLPKFLTKSCTRWKEYHLLNCSREALVPMGYYTPQSARGKFYLQTNEVEPFGLNGKFYQRILYFNLAIDNNLSITSSK